MSKGTFPKNLVSYRISKLPSFHCFPLVCRPQKTFVKYRRKSNRATFTTLSRAKSPAIPVISPINVHSDNSWKCLAPVRLGLISLSCRPQAIRNTFCVNGSCLSVPSRITTFPDTLAMTNASPLTHWVRLSNFQIGNVHLRPHYHAANWHLLRLAESLNPIRTFANMIDVPLRKK